MRTVLMMSVDEEFVIFKDAPDEKIALSDVVLLQCTGITNSDRKSIYEGDIVDFLIDAEFERAVVEPGGKNWVFHIANSDRLLPIWEYFSAEQFSKIKIVGNIYQHAELLSEMEIRKKSIYYLKVILGDTCWTLDYNDSDFCRHDIQKAFDKLSDLTKEELIDIVKSLSEGLRSYKEDYYEQRQKCTRRGPCEYYRPH